MILSANSGAAEYIQFLLDTRFRKRVIPVLFSIACMSWVPERVGMIDICANVECWKRLHYFREGIIYAMQIPALQGDGNGSNDYRTEHFWLCGRCSEAILEELRAGKRSQLGLRNLKLWPAVSAVPVSIAS
jgi:hypothetical protein